MDIRELAYQLYIIDWKHEHITPEIEADAWKDYFEDAEDFTEYSFEDYLWDCGYGSGTLYVCYEEFLNSEYLNEDYMKELLNNEKLFKMYLEDLEKNLYTD